MWASIGKTVMNALIGSTAIDAKMAILHALKDAEDAQIKALNGLDRKVDILLDAPFKAGRDELDAAQRAWRSAAERERLLESARALFVQASATAPDAARAAVCDWYLALCWLCLGHPDDARLALLRSHASATKAIIPARRAWSYADSRQQHGTWSTWREWRDRLWPKDEDEVRGIREATAAQMNAVCDLSRGITEVGLALGANRGLGRYWIARHPLLADTLCLVAGHRPGEVAVVDDLELTVSQPRPLRRRPWMALELEVHNPDETDWHHAPVVELAPDAWAPRDDWPRLEEELPEAEVDPARIRKAGETPLFADDESISVRVEPGATRRGAVLVPRKPAPRTVVFKGAWWMDVVAFALD